MTARFRILAVLLAGALAAHAEWPGVPYAKVRAYAWPMPQNEPIVVFPDLKIRGGQLPASAAPLSADQVARLLTAQKRRVTPRPLAACYVPHNAFVFFDAQAKPVAFLELCFDCLGARTFPEDADCDPDFVALGRIFSELKMPFGRFKTFAEFRSVTEPILRQP